MKIKILIGGIFFISLILVANLSLAAYTPLEEIPGTTGTSAINTFPTYVNAVYKFAIWSVGIAALLMISIGGFMYFTAAGNTSKMEGGKKIVTDALFGLIAVMVAWVVLNTINPNLTNISLKSVTDLSSSSSQLKSSH
ncbi:MAG: hypothetical protein WC682_00585 [Parcubacteria group bacterium]|jgi:hypothetical protein